MRKLMIALAAGIISGVGTHMLTFTDLLYARGMAVIGGEIFFAIANGYAAFYAALKIQDCIEWYLEIRAERARKEKARARICARR